MPRPGPAQHRAPALVVAICALSIAACAPSGATAGPSGSGSAATPSSTAPAPSSPASVLPSPSSAEASTSPAASRAMTQTDTDWGRIWDAVPRSFPVLQDASPVQAAEAVSLAYELSAPPKAIATALQAQLEESGFSTVSLSGPLEDGTFVIESVGEGACRLQTRVVPMGTTTRVLVRYGADCPFG